MVKQSLYLWLLWCIRTAGSVGGWVGHNGTYEESYLKFLCKRLLAKDINDLLYGVSFAAYNVPGQNEVLWLNFVCSRNQATDLRNLHKWCIILAVEERQNPHTILFLFHLLFSVNVKIFSTGIYFIIKVIMIVLFFRKKLSSCSL